MTQSCIRLACLTAFLGIVGCASAKKIIGPDGTENQLISCDEIEGCYEKATEVCAGPYKIVNSTSEVSGHNGISGTTVKLLVKCGAQQTTQSESSSQK